MERQRTVIEDHLVSEPGSPHSTTISISSTTVDDIHFNNIECPVSPIIVLEYNHDAIPPPPLLCQDNLDMPGIRKYQAWKSIAAKNAALTAEMLHIKITGISLTNVARCRCSAKSACEPYDPKCYCSRDGEPCTTMCHPLFKSHCKNYVRFAVPHPIKFYLFCR